MITVDYLLYATENYRDHEVQCPASNGGWRRGTVVAASTGGLVLPRSALRPGGRASAGSAESVARPGRWRGRRIM